ncbi:MAG TPA: hypothetical protein VG184_01865 [Acidimicrobiales bacterium]|nr:hypothetical protein [Acidimicrobiales bacterium]
MAHQALAPASSLGELRAIPTWSDHLVGGAGIEIQDVPFVTVGGGLGSFVMIDLLRIAGCPVSKLRVLTALKYPWQNYEYLTRVSQIPPSGRLRSDSASCPDNIWGFPSYAVREAVSAGNLKGFLAPLWNVLTEDVLCDYWTPKAGQVFYAMKREADRIGYWETVSNGQVALVHKRDQGGYFTLLIPPAGGRPVAYRSRFVHLAVGYPGLRFLDDLQRYRQNYGDHHRVVNAYEPHEHVYHELNRRGGTVVVRGGGIAASQILDRLISDRTAHGHATNIVHLLRTYVEGAHGPSLFMRRRGGGGWAYQGFNCPKSTWGGQGRARLQKLEGQDRVQLLQTMGGTTTARRKRWRGQLDKARREGYYRALAATVEEVVPESPGTVVVRLRPAGESGTVELGVNFIIDATGLEADLSSHPVLDDLLDHGVARRNPLGGLDVERSFELRGGRCGPGRIYAAGAATVGCYLAGVDTFLGLQIAALEAADDLATIGFCERIGVARSIAQWWKWARGRQP